MGSLPQSCETDGHASSLAMVTLSATTITAAGTAARGARLNAPGSLWSRKAELRQRAKIGAGEIPSLP